MKISSLKQKTSSLPQLSNEDAILGLHEAVTKLWISANKKDKNEKEISKRLANILIGTSLAAAALKISNLEHALEKRLKELSLELK